MSRYLDIHQAFVQGNLEALRNSLGNPPNFANSKGLSGFGDNLLEYAIYWSPLSFIRTLLELGADANYDDQAGFPSLVAALSTAREDKAELLDLCPIRE